jgi:hypothetical protein
MSNFERLRVSSSGGLARLIMRGLGRTPGVAAQGVALVTYPANYACLATKEASCERVKL